MSSQDELAMETAFLAQADQPDQLCRQGDSTAGAYMLDRKLANAFAIHECEILSRDRSKWLMSLD
jgi:hypothetical protein